MNVRPQTITSSNGRYTARVLVELGDTQVLFLRGYGNTAEEARQDLIASCTEFARAIVQGASDVKL